MALDVSSLWNVTGVQVQQPPLKCLDISDAVGDQWLFVALVNRIPILGGDGLI